MIELLQFQQEAATAIADRFLSYLEDPVITGTKKKQHRVPFFQALSSITASGKTVILAEATAQIAQALPVAPVVLWLSRGKVVVAQSYANLLAGGCELHETALLDGPAQKALHGFGRHRAADQEPLHGVAPIRLEHSQ